MLSRRAIIGGIASLLAAKPVIARRKHPQIGGGDGGGGGGGGPTPTAILDFLAGAYSVGASSYAIGDLLGTFLAPTANGLEVLTANANRPTAIGALKTIFDTNLYTCVMEVILFNASGLGQFIFPFMFDYNNAVDIFGDFSAFGGPGGSLNGDNWVQSAHAASENPDAFNGTIQRCAFTVQPTPYETSLTGAATASEPMLSPQGPRVWDVVYIGHSNDANNNPINGYIRKMTFYDPVDAATLQTLSAPPSGSPVNTIAPVVTGVAQVGQTLTCSTGTWTGDAAITFAYQWFTSYSGGQAIDGETANTFIPRADFDVGYSISCKVLATHALWAKSALSNATGPVIA